MVVTQLLMKLWMRSRKQSMHIIWNISSSVVCMCGYTKPSKSLHPVFKIEAFNVLQTQCGLSKYTSLKTIHNNVLWDWLYSTEYLSHSHWNVGIFRWNMHGAATSKTCLFCECWLQCSRLKSSMPFKHDMALQNIHLSKQSFKIQPQIENEDGTRSPQYNMPAIRTNKRRALSLQEMELDG